MPIVVTVRKREERLQDVSLAISAFSGDALEESGITDSKGLFGGVPNFNFVRQGAYVMSRQPSVFSYQQWDVFDVA